MLDGCFVETRERCKDGYKWIENKLAVMFAGTDMKVRGRRNGEETLKITKKEYVSCFGEYEEFQRQVWEAAVRNHCFEYEQIVVVSDGAAWIRKTCEELFPDCVQILDCWHLKENLYNFGKNYYGSGAEAEYTKFAESVMDLIWKGKKEEAYAVVEKHQDKGRPEGVVNLMTYIKNNWEKIDYPEYKAKGYCIGSGAIESGNKVAVEQRCKLSGMRWNKPTAQGVLTLRSRRLSGRWDEAVAAPFLRKAA
jgi:hypothetical protein